MYMKNHILAAMREEFDHWEKVIANLSETEITAMPQPGELSIKDEIAHLHAWQQRSIARMEAAQHNREPEFPQWLPALDAEAQDSTDQLNAWIYATYHDQPWSEVHQNWRDNFRRFLELAEAMPEPALLDSSRYAWLDGHPLAFVLVASYDHHQEHLEKLLTRLA